LKAFEFVVVFIFIILGMAISEVVVSVGQWLRHLPDVTFYWPLLIWMTTGWLLTINYFFSLYRLQKIQVWTIRNFGIIIFSTFTFVLCTYLVVPDGPQPNMPVYFRHNAQTIYIVVVAFLISLILESAYIYRSRNPINFFLPGVAIAVLTGGIWMDNTLSDYLISITMFAFQVVLMVRSRKVIA